MANREPSNSQSSSLAGAPRSPGFPNRLIRGNYASNAQQAALAQINDARDEVELAFGGATAEDLNSIASLAIFSQDIPLMVLIQQIYSADSYLADSAGAVFTQIGTDGYVANALYGGITASADASAANVEALGAESGLAVNTLVFGAGTPAEFRVPAYNLLFDFNVTPVVTVDGGEEIDAQVQVSFVAAGGVVAGYPTVTATESDPEQQLLPIILSAADYTEAIAEAGNVLTLGGPTFRVVGIWDVEAAPIVP